MTWEDWDFTAYTPLRVWHLILDHGWVKPGTWTRPLDAGSSSYERARPQRA